MGSVLANGDVKLQDLQKDTASRVTKCDRDQAREIKMLQHRDSGMPSPVCLAWTEIFPQPLDGWPENVEQMSQTAIANSSNHFQ